MEQAASTSGSASEEALSDRITGQEAELQRLRQERDALAKG
jgi:cell division protein FtsB